MAAVGGAGVLAAPAASADARHEHDDHHEHDHHGHHPGRTRVTVLGTTDLHGNVYNWNYFANAPTATARATRSAWPRPRRSSGRCARSADPSPASPSTPATPSRAPRSRTTTRRSTRSPRGAKHPMATAMNAIGYDAAALGNHEFNYGLDTLRAFERQCHHPLLSAQHGRLEHRSPGLPPLRHEAGQGPRPAPGDRRHPRPRDPRRRHLGQGERRGQGASSPASSSRRRSWCRG